MHKMNKAIFEQGGAFDTFAGDDNRMNLEEAKTMNAAIRKRAAETTGEEIAAYSDDEFAAMYKAYNSLSEGEGFSKQDMMTVQAMMDKFRDRRITDTEIDKFYPMGETVFYEWIDDLDEDSETYKHWLHWVENGNSEED